MEAVEVLFVSMSCGAVSGLACLTMFYLIRTRAERRGR